MARLYVTHSLELGGFAIVGEVVVTPQPTFADVFERTVAEWAAAEGIELGKARPLRRSIGAC
jgi:hypothetical protein